jgi:FkbM family methyltransferase
VFKNLKCLLADMANLRRYRAQRGEKLPWSIRLAYDRNRIRHAAHKQWPGGYIQTENSGYLYVPANVDLMAGRRLLKPADKYPLLQFWCPPGGVAIDVGANIGDWSVPIALAVGPNGKLLAVEPIPRMANALRKTFGINRLRQASLAQLALSSSAGKARFSVERGNSGGSRIGDHGLAHDSIEVDIITLDALVEREQLPRVDFIKIDVEGHEPDVLTGAEQTLLRWKPVLCIESGQEGDTGRASIANLLQNCGYQIAGYALTDGVIEVSWDEYRTGTGTCAEAGINNLIFF